MDLRGVKKLGTQSSRVDGTDGGYGIGFDAPNQMIQEVANLENLVRSSRDVGPLEKRGHVGSVGYEAHAIGIKKMNND